MNTTQNRKQYVKNMMTTLFGPIYLKKYEDDLMNSFLNAEHPAPFNLRDTKIG